MSKKGMTVLLVLASLIWGINTTITKGVITNIPPNFFVGMRFVISFIVVFIFQGKNIIKGFRKKDIKPIFIVSLFLTGGYIVCTISMLFTTATNCSFFSSLSVLMIPFLAKYINGNNFNKKLLIGILVTSVGMYFLISDGGSFSLNTGDLLALLGALFYALQVILTTKYVEDIDPIVLTSFQFLFVGIIAMAASLISGEHPAIASYGVMQWGAILFSSIIATALVYVIQTFAQTKVSESTVGITYATVPLFTVISAWIFLGEKLSVMGIIGAVIMVAGVGLSSLCKNN